MKKYKVRFNGRNFFLAGYFLLLSPLVLMDVVYCLFRGLFAGRFAPYWYSRARCYKGWFVYRMLDMFTSWVFYAVMCEMDGFRIVGGVKHHDIITWHSMSIMMDKFGVDGIPLYASYGESGDCLLPVTLSDFKVLPVDQKRLCVSEHGDDCLVFEGYTHPPEFKRGDIIFDDGEVVFMENEGGRWVVSERPVGKVELQ